MDPKMPIGGLCQHQLILSAVVGVGSLIDRRENAVWLLTLEDEFCRIMKIVVKIMICVSVRPVRYHTSHP